MKNEEWKQEKEMKNEDKEGKHELEHEWQSSSQMLSDVTPLQFLNPAALEQFSHIISMAVSNVPYLVYKLGVTIL